MKGFLNLTFIIAVGVMIIGLAGLLLFLEVPEPDREVPAGQNLLTDILPPVSPAITPITPPEPIVKKSPPPVQQVQDNPIQQVQGRSPVALKPSPAIRVSPPLVSIPPPLPHQGENQGGSPSFFPPPTTHGFSAPKSEFRQSPEIPTANELANVPPCANQTFVSAPTDLARLYALSPLGNLGPPGHTFPTEHMFFHLNSGGASSETFPLYAPADVTVTLIAFGRGLTQDPIDYTVYFALCQDVFVYYNHVKSLSPELDDIVKKGQCQFSGESKETRCNIQTLAPIKNGALMGRVGGLQGNFDLGVFDLRKKNVFANPARYGIRSLYVKCPLDYFEAGLKSKLNALNEHKEKGCGEVAQDVLGTLKGNWFYGNARADMGGDWDKYLAFVSDSRDPSLSVISIGGTLTEAGKWEFKAVLSGEINRDFKEVKPDAKIYCYEVQGKPGRIILELASDTELKIEHQSGNCSGALAFISPKIYKR